VLLGYARVSTADQNPDHQVDALRRAGVAEKDIYVDHASGAKASRPRLDEVLRVLRDGDTLKITRLDRLGRPVGRSVPSYVTATLACTLSSRASTPRQPRAARCSACSLCSRNCSAS
jgi:DNA invertase Pin-like site-specific DNA recombinase